MGAEFAEDPTANQKKAAMNTGFTTDAENRLPNIFFISSTSRLLDRINLEEEKKLRNIKMELFAVIIDCK
jgi:hypothetical protein